MANASLVFDIIANDKGSQAINNFATKLGSTFQNLGSKIGGEFGNLVSEVGSGLETVGKSVPKFGAQMQAVGTAAFGVGTALQLLGSKGQQAQGQLRAAIEATGNTWSDYQSQIEATVKQQENFAHSAADTENALQTLTAATNDPTKALKNMQVVADLAAARHISLSDAAMIVAKTLEGSVKILKQYGISLDGVGSKTDQAQRAVDQLGKKFSGQAQASVATFAGQLDVLKTKALDVADSFAGPLGAGLQGFGAGTALLGTVLESKLVGKLRLAAKESEGFVATTKALTSVMGPAVVGVGKYAVGLAAVVLAGRGLESLTGGGLDAQAQNIDKLTKSTHDLKFQFDNAFGTGGGFTNVLNGIDNFGRHIVGAKSYIDQGEASMANLDKAMAALAKGGNAGAAAAAFAKVAKIAQDEGVSMADLIKMFPEYTSAAGLVAGANDTITHSVKSMTQVYAEHMVQLGLYIDRLEASKLAAIDARQANRDAIKTIKDLGKQHKETAQQVDDAMRVFIAAADGARNAVEGAANKDVAYRNELVRLRDHLKKGSPLWNSLNDYILKLGDIPRTIASHATLDISTALANLKALKTSYRLAEYGTGNLPGVNIKGTNTQGSSAGKGGNPAHRAAGGPVMAGVDYWVGERGPEEFISDRPGRIIPHGAGTTVIYMTNHITTSADPREVVHAIQKYERRSGKGWRS